jgi:glucose/arabinose dehydrogenase
VEAAVIPSASDVHWDQVAGDLNSPVGFDNAGDGSGRLFILEQPGRILILKDGNTLAPPFLDIRDRVGRRGSEQGLLGLAFHPRYAENGFFYVNYTDLNGDTNISRFSVDGANPDIADPSSEKRLMFVEQPYPNHNGGSVVFGPDGYLYLGLGDGGAGGDPQGNAQSTDTLLGKILRIDINSGDPYTIPPDNPFAGGGGLPEIWAYGLRNPWRFSFDPLLGDVYIGDVGQNAWEEIDYLPAGSSPGANFGWDRQEGLHHFEGVNLGDNFIDPVAEYDHSQGCSVTGGVVYRGSNLAGWQGVYLYGDYCSGRVWGLLHTPDGNWQNELLFQTGMSISSFGVDESGEVYLLDHNGSVYRLVQ